MQILLHRTEKPKQLWGKDAQYLSYLFITYLVLATDMEYFKFTQNMHSPVKESRTFVVLKFIELNKALSLK